MVSEIEKEHASPVDQFDALLKNFEGTLACKKICIFGAMSGELRGLPETLQAELKSFIGGSIAGIKTILARAQASGDISKDYDCDVLAELWNNTLQGTMAIGRATGCCGLSEPIAMLRSMTFARLRNFLSPTLAGSDSQA